MKFTDQDTIIIVTVVLPDQSSLEGYHFTDHFSMSSRALQVLCPDHLKCVLSDSSRYLQVNAVCYPCPPENDHPTLIPLQTLHIMVFGFLFSTNVISA